MAIQILDHESPADRSSTPKSRHLHRIRYALACHQRELEFEIGAGPTRLGPAAIALRPQWETLSHARCHSSLRAILSVVFLTLCWLVKSFDQPPRGRHGRR